MTRAQAAVLSMIVATCLTTAARSDDLAEMELEQQLGSILGAEHPCGLTYDQDAIRAFIESKVASDSMGFTSGLDIFAEGFTFQMMSMSASQKTATCKQTERVARSYHFIH